MAQGGLKGFLDSRAASRGTKTRAETKVSVWEAKLRSLVEEGAAEERILWGRPTFARRRRRWPRSRRHSRGSIRR